MGVSERSTNVLEVGGHVARALLVFPAKESFQPKLVRDQKFSEIHSYSSCLAPRLFRQEDTLP